MFEKQSPTSDVTMTCMLFCIIYAGQAALTFGNNAEYTTFGIDCVSKNCSDGNIPF